MKLYYWPAYRSVRCIWLIKELGVEDDFEFVKMQPNGPDKKALDDYVKNVHPHGQIPALEIEGNNSIVESGAICLYLANTYGKLGPDEDNVADYYNWVVYATATMDTILSTLLSHYVLHLTKYDDAFMERTHKRWTSSLDFLTKKLSDGRQFICGNKFTAADCVLGYCVAWADYMKEQNLLQNHPAVLDYLKRLQSRPAYQKAFEFV